MQKTTGTIYLSILFIFSLLSCGKNKKENTDYPINYIVIDYATGLPVPKQKVYLVDFRGPFIVPAWQVQNGDTILNVNPSPLVKDSTITDGNGRFSFANIRSFDAINNTDLYRYPIIFDKDYISVLRPFMVMPPFPIDTIFIDKKGFFTINVQKTTPASFTDTIFHTTTYISDNPDYTVSRLPVGQIGSTGYSVMDEFAYHAYKKAVVKSSHSNKGVPYYHTDTIILNASGKTTFNINY